MTARSADSGPSAHPLGAAGRGRTREGWRRTLRAFERSSLRSPGLWLSRFRHVKGGRTVTPQVVRDLIGTVETQKAQMGVLISFADPTRGVLDAADHGGTYQWPVNRQVFPRVQVITVAELLRSTRPNMPPVLMPYIPASRVSAQSAQLSLDT
jgi:hypothetical protein